MAEDVEPPESLWRDRDFTCWMIGTSSDSLSSSIVTLAIPLIAVSVSGDAVLAGVMGSLYAGLFAALVLIGGVVVDWYDRRTLMIIRSVSGFVVWAGFGALVVAGLAHPAALAAAVALSAISAGVLGTADNAALRSVVPDRLIVRAQGPIQARRAVVELLGAPLGGALYAVSPSVPFFVAAVGGAMLGITTCLIASDLKPKAVTASPEPIPPPRRRLLKLPRDLAQGLKFCFQEKTVLQGSLMVAVLNLCISAALSLTTLLLIIQGHPPAAIGFLLAGSASPMLLGALVNQWVIKRFRGGTIVISSMFVIATGLAVVAVRPTYWVIFAGLAILALVVPIISATLQGVVALATPKDLQGRVISAMTLASLGLSAVAPLLAGIMIASDLNRVGYLAAAVLAALTATVAAIVGPMRDLGLAESGS